ncbi:MAG TPA: DUF805 domain-containing protein [Burkholderiales bacterium]|nr:DUF805 domain-containing protein [Burkholderiales bacterium]
MEPTADLTALLFSFRGRINRKPYWKCLCGVFFADMILSILMYPFDEFVQGAAQFGFMAGALWPLLALQTKRWHDRDKSAWWLLVNFIPYIGILWVIIECGVLRGTEGANRFGPDPLGLANHDARGDIAESVLGDIKR